MYTTKQIVKAVSQLIIGESVEIPRYDHSMALVRALAKLPFDVISTQGSNPITLDLKRIN